MSNDCQSTPENYSFIVQDAEQTWQLGNQFDLIHGRALAACFGNNRAVVQHAFAQLNQGGYLEILDGIMPFRADDSSLQSSSLDEWQTAIFQEGMARLGRTPSDSQNWGKYLREEGFVDVVEKYYYVPIGPWCRGLEDKTRGIAMQQDLLMGLDAIGLPIFTNVLGWTKEEHDTLMEKAKVDLRSPDIHSYVEFYVVYGRKP